MRPGDVVGKRFVIEHVAGSGGMGVVYRARDADQGSVVAPKIQHRGGDNDQTRFIREARVLADLDDPGIVRHVAHGVSEAGQLYLAMEWLHGEDLAARLKRKTLTVCESL